MTREYQECPLLGTGNVLHAITRSCTAQAQLHVQCKVTARKTQIHKWSDSQCGRQHSGRCQMPRVHWSADITHQQVQVQHSAEAVRGTNAHLRTESGMTSVHRRSPTAELAGQWSAAAWRSPRRALCRAVASTALPCSCLVCLLCLWQPLPLLCVCHHHPLPRLCCGDHSALWVWQQPESCLCTAEVHQLPGM